MGMKREGLFKLHVPFFLLVITFYLQFEYAVFIIVEIFFIVET